MSAPDSPYEDETPEETEEQRPESDAPALSLEKLQELVPPENHELLHAVLEIAAEPTGDRSRLYAALMNGTYLVPLTSAPPAAAAEDAPPVSVDVLTLTGPGGELVLPVFTHQAGMQAWTDANPPTISIQGMALFQLTASTPIALIVVNPAGPFGGQVARQEFELMAGGVLPVTAPASGTDPGAQNIYIDAPLVPISEAVTGRLYDWLEGNAAVSAAYLFLMQVGDAGTPRLTLGIRPEGPAAQWVIPQIARLLQSESHNFEPYELPDLIRLDEMAGSEQALAAIPPLFSRPGDAAAAGGVAHDPEADGPDSDEWSGEDVTDVVDSFDAGEDSGTTMTTAADESSAGRPRRSLWPFRRR